MVQETEQRLDSQAILPEAWREQPILVVDHFPEVLDTLKFLFRWNDFQFDVATTGEEALEKLHDYPAKVVLSELRLGGMPGTEFLRKLREEHPEVVILVLSTFSPGDVEDGVLSKIGVYRFMEKPWDNDDLLECVEESLIRASRWPKANAPDGSGEGASLWPTPA